MQEYIRDECERKFYLLMHLKEYSGLVVIVWISFFLIFSMLVQSLQRTSFDNLNRLKIRVRFTKKEQI
jgi:hypothetical protein